MKIIEVSNENLIGSRTIWCRGSRGEVATNLIVQLVSKVGHEQQYGANRSDPIGIHESIGHDKPLSLCQIEDCDKTSCRCPSDQAGGTGMQPAVDLLDQAFQSPMH